MSVKQIINKVIDYSNISSDPVLLDLTHDTVTRRNLEKDATAHDKEGEPVTGQLLIEDAEAWARGTRDGIPVSEEDITYHNNSRYYSIVSGSIMNIAGQQAAAAATSAENAEYYMEESQAASIASGSSMLIAGNYANDSEESALKSEGYAVGKQNGSDVGSTSPYYHNNAEYYKEMAEAAVQSVSDMTGATALADGTHGLIKQPHAGDQNKYFRGDGNWSTVAASEVSYDNTTSGLTADDTQEAIDEVSALVNGATEITTKAFAPVISVSDAIPVNAVDVKAKIEPIQDLHGYDKPWVGGAGRNLFNMGSKISATFAGMTVTSDNDSITFNGTKYGTGEYRPSELLLTLPAGTYYVKAFPNKSMDYAPGVYINTSNCNNIEQSFTISEESNINVAFGFYKDNITYTDYKLQIVISSTSGIDKFYPYTNICPISGRSSVKVTRTGKNLFDMVSNVSFHWWAGLDVTSDNDSITFNGTKYGANELPVLELDFVLPAGTYYAKSFANKVVDYPPRVHLKKINIDGSLSTLARIDDSEQSFTISESTNIRVVFTFYKDYATYTDYSVQIVVSQVSGINQFEPYTGNSYTVQLGDTYYGCELDVTTGVLTVTDGYIASYNGETLPSTWISDRDEYTAGGTPTTGAQVVYKLATPITIQLTPQEIQLLQNNNTIYADSGDTSLQYYANGVKNLEAIVGAIQDDVNDIEDKVEIHDVNFAPVESGSTASKAYTTGQYIERPDGLYKVIADIASGASFTVNTNIKKVNVGEELTHPSIPIDPTSAEISGFPNGAMWLVTS